MLPSNIMSVPQEIAMFQALDIPFSTVGWTLTDNIGTVRSSAQITPVVNVIAEIEAYITGGTVNQVTYPPMNTDVLTVLKSYLDAWINLGYDMTVVNDGQVGNLTNIIDDPRDTRKILREYIRGLVPFYTKFAYEQKLQGDGVSSNGVASGGQASSVEVIR